MADLRPLTFGEVLDGAVTLFRRHFGLFLQLSVVVLALPVALYGYAVAPLLANPMFLMFDPMGSALRVGVIGMILYLASLVLTAATVRVVSDSYLGRSPGFRSAISLGLSKSWPLFVVGVGKGVVLGGLGGLVAAVALGAGFAFQRGGNEAAAFTTTFALGGIGALVVIWVACGYGVTTQIVVLGQWRRALEAFGQSWRLTRGARLKIFGLAAVAFLLFNVIPSWLFQVLGAFTAASPGLLTTFTVLQLVVPMVLAPAIACVFTLMYYDLRVRHEAFDIQVLSQQLGPA